MSNENLDGAVSGSLECTDMACSECGEIFTQETVHQLFCSEKCKDNSFDWYISMTETYGDGSDTSE